MPSAPMEPSSRARSRTGAVPCSYHSAMCGRTRSSTNLRTVCCMARSSSPISESTSSSPSGERSAILVGLPAVRHGDDLEPVAVGVVPVDATAAVVVVDLAGLAVEGIRPVVESALPDAAEDLVELLVADQEGV